MIAAECQFPDIREPNRGKTTTIKKGINRIKTLIRAIIRLRSFKKNSPGALKQSIAEPSSIENDRHLPHVLVWATRSCQFDIQFRIYRTDTIVIKIAHTLMPITFFIRQFLLTRQKVA